jgi:hypothetical protein
MSKLSLSHSQALYVLELLAARGVKKYLVGKVAVWCGGEADPMEVYDAAFRSLGYRLRDVLANTLRTLQGVRSRRWCMRPLWGGFYPHDVVAMTVYADMISELADGRYEVIEHYKRFWRGVVKIHKKHICVDVERLRARITEWLQKLGVAWVYA